MRQVSRQLRLAAASLAAAAALLTAGAASAQQMSWTGLYLGGHLGGSWGSFDDVDVNGFLGGLHGGYNLQNGNIVYGIEGDFSWTGADATDSQTGAAGICVANRIGCLAGAAATSSINLDWLASLRARLGVTFGNVLVYGTGGVGWGNVDLSVSAAGLGTSSSSNTHVGFVAGGGAEMKFTPNLSGRVEALYYGLGSETYNIFGTSTKLDLDTTVVRAGLSYHFN
jgi:outer membrane immunogenic protein